MLPLYDDRPKGRFPFATLLLILLNLWVFLGWQLRVGIPESIEMGGMVPAEIMHSPSPDSFIHMAAAMFMHAGWMHILGNMWFLWIFGAGVEGVVGSGGFLLFYLLCGFFAGLTHVVLSPGSLLPMIGASGAISGVLGAYLILHPGASISTFFFFRVIRVRAWFFLLFWIGFQILSQAAERPGQGGVAYLAHIGGFFSGLLLIFFFKKARR